MSTLTTPPLSLMLKSWYLLKCYRTYSLKILKKILETFENFETSNPMECWQRKKDFSCWSIQVWAEIGLTGMHVGISLHTCYFPRGKHKHQLSADRLNQEKLDRAEMRYMYFKSDVLQCFNQLVQRYQWIKIC